MDAPKIALTIHSALTPRPAPLVSISTASRIVHGKLTQRGSASTAYVAATHSYTGSNASAKATK